MGYLYDKVKESLGGSKFVTGSSSGDWSPNNVRILIINRYFIFVGYHVSSPTCIMLNPESVSKDLQYNGSNGAIHNLLSTRKLSCMEEIYVDSMFQHYKGLFNLESYILGLANGGSSRLRYYGYGNFNPDCSYLKNKYRGIIINPDYLYSYALDKNKPDQLQFSETGFKNWYKKFNLQPQSYKMDSDKGKLSIYFNKGCTCIEGMLQEIANKGIQEKYSTIVVNMIEKDKSCLNNVMLLLRLNKYINTHKDTVLDCIGMGVRDALSNLKMFKGLSLDLIQSSYKYLNKNPDTEVINLLKVYKKFNLLDSKENNLQLEDFLKVIESRKELGNSVLCVDTLLDTACVKACEHLINRSKSNMLLVYSILNEFNNYIPKGKLSETYNIGGTCTSSDGLIDVLYGLCGLNRKSKLGGE